MVITRWRYLVFVQRWYPWIRITGQIRKDLSDDNY